LLGFWNQVPDLFDLGGTVRALRLEQHCDRSVRGDSEPSFAGDLCAASFGRSSNLDSRAMMARRLPTHSDSMRC
jgi:hypothetical protein